jgi:hypothetical protein
LAQVQSAENKIRAALIWWSANLSLSSLQTCESWFGRNSTDNWKLWLTLAKNTTAYKHSDWLWLDKLWLTSTTCFDFSYNNGFGSISFLYKTMPDTTNTVCWPTLSISSFCTLPPTPHSTLIELEENAVCHA